MSLLPHILSVDNDNFHFERELQSRGYVCVAGADEVGRGPLAGPVVAACVSLPSECDPAAFFDSKKTSLKQRTYLAEKLHKSKACIGIGIISHDKIDEINILQASLLAMKLAALHHSCISITPDYILVDGKFEIPLGIPQQALIKGETKSASIAAASIIAKVKRDTIMSELHKRYPQYNFGSNKGYPTKLHRAAIEKFGPCPFHRKTFKGVREFVVEKN